MSILGKKWIVKNRNKAATTLEKLFENRKHMDFDEELEFHDPFLFEDMVKAIKRIKEAIDKEERIIVFGDYDVDGITGTAILVHILNKLNAKVSYRLPNRVTDGYGISEKFIKDFVENKVGLIITTDCGISNADLIAEAKDKGIDFIVTDHHAIPENIPDAAAIIHPKLEGSEYPYKELTGAGVALKLAQGLIQEFIPEEKTLFHDFMDLAAMGTVADLGPLTGENRLIVKEGLKRLAQTKWVGLKKLMQLASIKTNMPLDTAAIGFRIAPRINAAGRIDDPYVALTLLLQDKLNEKVDRLSQKLEALNLKRQEMTFEGMLEAEERLSHARPFPKIIIDSNTEWHVGILGLIAGRLTEQHARPTIIMQDLGDTLVASARGPQFFNIVEALTANKKHLIAFGGHAQAAGFSLKKKNLKAFTKDMNSYTEKKLKGHDLMPYLNIDCELDHKNLDLKFIKKLDKLRPFGIANERPTFVLKNIEPLFISQVGKEKSHLKFNLSLNDKDIGVIAFRMGKHVDTMRRHRKIDLVFQIEKNVWNNRESVQLHALDFRKSEG